MKLLVMLLLTLTSLAALGLAAPTQAPNGATDKLRVSSVDVVPSLFEKSDPHAVGDVFWGQFLVTSNLTQTSAVCTVPTNDKSSLTNFGPTPCDRPAFQFSVTNFQAGGDNFDLVVVHSVDSVGVFTATIDIANPEPGSTYIYKTPGGQFEPAVWSAALAGWTGDKLPAVASS